MMAQKIDIDPDGDVFLILSCEEGQSLDASSWPPSLTNPLLFLGHRKKKKKKKTKKSRKAFGDSSPVGLTFEYF